MIAQFFQRKFMGFPGLRVQPVSKPQKACEWRIRQQQRQRARKPSRVADEIPVTCKAHDALHVGKGQHSGGKHRVRRIRTVAHRMRCGVAVNRRTAQALEYADLDFMRAQRVQAVEAAAESGKVLARQPGDQVDVDQRRRLLAQYRGELIAEAPITLSREAAGQPDAAEVFTRHFSGPRAALLAKEFRYLTRNVVTVLNLCVPFFLIIFFGLLMDQRGTEMDFFQRRPEAVLPSAMGYSIFIALPVAHNSLSFESWGIQLLLLAPVRFREVFIAKNFALGLAVFGQAVVVLLLVTGLFGPQQPVIIAATFVALLFMLLLNFSVGNLLSLYFPRAFDFGSFSQRQSPWSVIGGIVLQLVGMFMVYAVYGIALLRGNAWYAVIAYALMSAAVFQVYLLILNRCDELAEERKEILIKEICRN